MNEQISKVYLLPRLYGTTQLAILIHIRHVNGRLVTPPEEEPCIVPRTHKAQPNHVMCCVDITEA
jgi:hypothetical protein